ncbi:unnamed protein product, partial [marine sediment metagenome]
SEFRKLIKDLENTSLFKELIDKWKVICYRKFKGVRIPSSIEFREEGMFSSDDFDLERYPPFSVEISLYGITKKTYERVTCVPGSFEHCIRGIELLVERQIPLMLKTVVMTINKHELWEIREYAENLGVQFTFDAAINPKLDGSKEPCQLRVTPQEVVKLDLADEKRTKAWREFCQRLRSRVKSDRLYVCGAGQTSFHIDPYGELTICGMSRDPSYNLPQGSFRDGWCDFIARIREQRPKTDYQCGKCDLLPLCGQCPGWAKLENGNSEIPI